MLDGGCEQDLEGKRKQPNSQTTYTISSMKLKIKITGPKVHDVGYRVFLLKNAMNLALPGLSTYNWEENEQKEVIVLVEGDEARIAAFRGVVEEKKPELAEVSGVTYENYDGEVGRTSEVAMFCSFVQLDKAIPLLLDMKDDLKEMKCDLKEMKCDLKEMKCDMKEMKCDMKEMKCDMKEVRMNTEEIPQIREEIKGLRDDLQPGYARQVREDIRDIKERLGMS